MGIFSFPADSRDITAPAQRKNCRETQEKSSENRLDCKIKHKYNIDETQDFQA